MITITIAGLAGSGKSAVSELICQALADKGFKIEIFSSSGEHVQKQISLDKRIAAVVARDSCVQIQEIQLARGVEQSLRLLDKSYKVKK